MFIANKALNIFIIQLIINILIIVRVSEKTFITS